MEQMQGRQITRYCGGTFFTLLALAWGALRKGDEIGGVWSMLTGWGAVFEFVADWGWIALLALAAAILIWGDPRGWPALVSRGRPSEFISLAEAVRYVGERSVWAKKCPAKMKEWNTILPKEIIDAAGIGAVYATGCRPRNKDYEISKAFGRVPIEAASWETACFQGIPNIMEPPKETTNVLYDQTSGLTPIFLDVKLRAADVRKQWPALPPWDKFESPVTRTREGRPLDGEN